MLLREQERGHRAAVAEYEALCSRLERLALETARENGNEAQAKQVAPAVRSGRDRVTNALQLVNNAVAAERGFDGDDGTWAGTKSLWLSKSTARRDMLLQWAHGNGLPPSEKTEAAVLTFFATQYSLSEVVSNALLCHMPPAFSVANAA